MKRNSLPAFIIALSVSSTLWAADLTMTTKTSGTVKDQSTSYISSNWMRTNSPGYGIDVLTDIQKGIRYTIVHKTKTIRFTKLDDLAAAAKATGPHGQGEQMEAAMKNMYGDPAIFKVESTGKETVMGRSCANTRVTSGNLVWEFCVDPTLHSPVSPAMYLKLTNSSYSGMSQYPTLAKIMSNLTGAMAKLDGLPLKMKMSGFGGERVSEVTSVTQGALPASTFALPAGYTMVDALAERAKAMNRSRH